jgi:hypothetical protein
VVGNNGMVRALNLDEQEIPVTIGGRGFILKQQAKRPLMRVLDAIFQSDKEQVSAVEADEVAADGAPAEESAPLEQNVAQTFIQEWDKSLPVIAMMFGFYPGKEDEWNDCLQYLEEHLAPMAGVKVFHAWWSLNEIDSFFMRCGRTLIHPELERHIEAEVRRRFQTTAQEIVDTALVSEAVSE